jgi:hypothetical protein
MRFFYTVLIVSAGILVWSCSKTDDSPEDLNQIDHSDTTFPVLTVRKPIANQQYASGDSIIVEGIVNDEKKMYKGKVEIKNEASGFTQASYYETHFLTAISFRLAYKAVVTVPTDFSVLVEFQDHGANMVSSTIKVKVNP